MEGYLEGLGNHSWDLFGMGETYPKTLTVKISFWLPYAVFHANGKEKAELLAKYFDREVVNLDELGCPRIENLHFKNYPSCNKHLHHYNSRNHCALKKPMSFLFRWQMSNNEKLAKTETYQSPDLVFWIGWHQRVISK